MLMFYTNDPVADFHRYDSERERALQKLPKCSECGEPIQDEECFVYDGRYICESCMEGFKKYVEDLID